VYKILKTHWKALLVFILLFVCIVGFLYYNSNNQSHKTGLTLLKLLFMKGIGAIIVLPVLNCGLSLILAPLNENWSKKTLK